MKLSEVDLESIESIGIWRSNILTQALKLFTTPFQDVMQNLTAIHEPAKMASISNEAVLPNGCIVLDATIAGVVIHYSVWLALGGVRIGFRLPSYDIPSGADHMMLSKLFDGRECQRHHELNGQAMYDWIFSDGLARSDSILKAMSDNIVGAALTIFISEYLTHIYMGSSSIIRAFSSQSAINQVDDIASDAMECLIQFSGNADAIVHFIKQRGGVIISVPDREIAGQSQSPHFQLKLQIDPSKCDLFENETYSDQDGSVFIIHSIVWIKK